MGKLLEPLGDLQRLVHLGSTGGALAHVRAQGGQTKPPLAVDEEIDLVGK
jgi:hypothetical protein